RCITTRFYTDEPVGRNAWDKVQARQKRDHISCSQAIVALLNEHDESILSDEQLADMTRRITECVMDELQKTLPSFIAGCVLSADNPDGQRAVPCFHAGACRWQVTDGGVSGRPG